MNKLIIIVCLLFFACSNKQDDFYKETKSVLLENGTIDLRYNKPPTYSEFLNGIKPKKFNKRPDSISRLKLYIVREPLKLDLKNHLNDIPKEYKFVFENSVQVFNYLPEKSKNFNNYNFSFVFINETQFDSIFNSQEFKSSLDVGGVIAYSKVYMNETNNKAVIFKSRMRGNLNASSDFILLEKKQGVWIIVGYTGGSIS